MDTVYYNGTIITLESEADNPEAVLTRDGRIIAVGTLAEIKTLAHNSETIYKDLEGHCMLPAFIDAHSHIMMAGQMAACADLSECSCFEDIISVLKEYMLSDNFNGRMIIGFGYDHNFLAEKAHPDKHVLDKAAADIPIMIMHISAHFACANSKLLELAGIDENTDNPSGGRFGRIPGSNEPDGYIEEAALMPVQKIIAGMTEFNPVKMLNNVQNYYAQYGITTVQEGAANPENIAMLKKASENGLLKLDVVAYPVLNEHTKGLLEKYPDINCQYSNNLKLGGYKLILDGSPQGRSAWLSKPYLNGEPDYCGYPWLKTELVEDLLKYAVASEKQVLAHCNGDAASEQFICAYEKALSESGTSKDLRPVMIHCQTVRNDQLDRMAKLNMIASVFVGHVYYWGDIHMSNFGPERGNHISPVKDALDRGLTVNFHQDAPVTKPDMLHSVWCAVNRISRNGNIIGENQKISVYEALKAITINAAYEYNEENIKGSIAKGKNADFAILDKNPLTCPKAYIKDIRVLETIKNGETIYSF